MNLEDMPESVIYHIIRYLEGVDYDNFVQVSPFFQVAGRRFEFIRRFAGLIDSNFTYYDRFRDGSEAMFVINDSTYYILPTAIFRQLPLVRLGDRFGYIEPRVDREIFEQLYHGFIYENFPYTGLAIWYKGAEIIKRVREEEELLPLPLHPLDNNFAPLINLALELGLDETFPQIKRLLELLLDDYWYHSTIKVGWYHNEAVYWYQWLDLNLDAIRARIFPDKEIDPTYFMVKYGYWIEKGIASWGGGANLAHPDQNPFINLRSIEGMPWEEAERIMWDLWGKLSTREFEDEATVVGSAPLWALLKALGDPRGDWRLTNVNVCFDETTCCIEGLIAIRNVDPLRRSYTQEATSAHYHPEIFQEEFLLEDCLAPEEPLPHHSELTCFDRDPEHIHIRAVPIWNTVQKSLLRCDISLSQIYWNGDQIYLSLACLESIRQGCFYHRIGTSSERIENWRGRGFEPIPTTLEESRGSIGRMWYPIPPRKSRE